MKYQSRVGVLTFEPDGENGFEFFFKVGEDQYLEVVLVNPRKALDEGLPLNRRIALVMSEAKIDGKYIISQEPDWYTVLDNE